jgi:hypothetical protein
MTIEDKKPVRAWAPALSLLICAPMSLLLSVALLGAPYQPTTSGKVLVILLVLLTVLGWWECFRAARGVLTALRRD